MTFLKTQSGSYQPGIFYEYRDTNNSFVIRGLSFRYALFNMDENLLSSVFLRAGMPNQKIKLILKNILVLKPIVYFVTERGISQRGTT